jgi:hypothetical protein
MADNDAEPKMAKDAGDIPDDVLQTMNDIINDSKYDDSVEIDNETTDKEDTEVVDDAEVVDDTEPVAEDADTTPADDGTSDADEFEEIDARLVNAARRFGWSDEKIIRVAEDDETILEDLANLLDRTLEQDRQKKQDTDKLQGEPDTVPALDKFELSDEELVKLKDSVGDEGAGLIKGLADRLNIAVDRLNEVQGDVSSNKKAEQDRLAQNRLERANTIFDEMSESFPVFSKSDKLPIMADGTYDRNSLAFKARAEVFAVAEQFSKMGLSFDKAMDEAMTWFAGKQGSKHVENKVVKQLNARKKQFTARPTHKKTEKQFSSKEDEAEHTMSEIFEKLGIKPD